MFTGIIEHTGTVKALRAASGGARLTLECAPVAESTSPGASIAINGVCLTVAAIDPPTVSFDVITETLDRSTLGDLKPGTPVNLELSLRAGDPIDGHFVQGHVDGVATLVNKTATDREFVLRFQPEDRLRPFLIPKGSVAIDGVSLTVAEVDGERFSVAIIPTTLGLTTLGTLRVGQRVNIETDIIARTVVHQLDMASDSRGITPTFLHEHGFS